MVDARDLKSLGSFYRTGSSPVSGTTKTATWPSGKAEDCKSFTLSSNLSVAFAGVAEQADAQDLKSCEANPSYRFDSGLRHNQESDFKIT